MQPNIQLKFNKELDQEMAWDFYNDSKFAGCDFWKERALKYHPKLSDIESAENKKEFLEKYINDFYSENEKKLNELSKKTKNYLEESRVSFFQLVNSIFNDYSWSQKEYTGFFSIFDFCPRFLDSGSFQIFLYDNKSMQLFTIFHEMLHFIFYDFAQKNFPEKLGKLNTEKGEFWDLAEVFNAVVQDTDDFIKLHGKIECVGYPNHREMIKRGSEIWKNSQDIKFWIGKMME